MSPFIKTLAYGNIEIEHDYRNDGATEQYTVRFDLMLDGDTYKVERVWEFDPEYGERSLSIMLDGIDLADSENWQYDENDEQVVPHVARVLDDGDGWFSTFAEWIDDTFIWPCEHAAQAARTAKIEESSGPGVYGTTKWEVLGK